MDAQSTNQLIYRPLDGSRREIRPLTIQTSTALDSPIECSLEIVSLDDDIGYLALSYVWGDANVKENIVVNGFDVLVTTNLVAALRQMRQHQAEPPSLYKKLPSLLWVDAICINQGDILERGSQVSIMGYIFRQAEKVLSWLGPEANHSATAMKIILRVHKELESLSEEDDRFAWLVKYPEFTSNLTGPNPWRFVDALWERDYWRRVWTLQEIVLSRDILLLCGKCTVPWEYVIKVNEWASSIKHNEPRPSFIASIDWCMFTGKPRFNPRPVSINQILRNMWTQGQYGSDVEHFGFSPLEFGSVLEATDARDKVFALLGVMNVGIVPDYSISVHDVYVDTASRILTHHGLTRLLGICGRAPTNPHSLPSWVPDWSWHPAVAPPLSHMPFVAQTSLNYHTEGSILRVTGICLSRVRELESEAPVPPYYKPLRNSITTFRFCQRYLERHDGGMYVTGIPPLQAVLRLLTQDKDCLNDRARLQIPSDKFVLLALQFVGALCAFSVENRGAGLEGVLRNTLPKLGLSAGANFATSFSHRFLGADSPLCSWESSQAVLDGQSAAWIRIDDRLRGMLRGRCFFHTDSEYLGVGPDTMIAGDLLYGLKDCLYPIILRPVESHYEVVGACIVQGFMDGEIQTILDGESDLELIEIH
jgi:hypothetical protein